MLNLELKKQIKEYCVKNIPLESCGLLLDINSNYEFFPCRNISYNKENHCILDPMDYILASGRGNIIAHIHSQPSNSPSIVDYFSSYNHNIYSIIYCWQGDKFYTILPKLKDYLDKDFQIGIYDCFELVRNYYKQELGIEINNYGRDASWFERNPKVICENFQNEGFREVYGYENLKENDVLLFGKKKEEINHMGIYLKNDLILHHPRKMKSVIEYLNEHYKKDIILVARHKNYE